MLILKCCEIVVTFCCVPNVSFNFVDLKRGFGPFFLWPLVEADSLHL